jgi:hypothetical protein
MCGATAGERLMTSRIDAIDFWRGFALLTIFADHMPGSVLAHVTYRNFGFSDAAEAFVFLSGMSVALAYGPRLLDGRIVAGLHAVVRRLLTIYAVQIVLSFLALGVLVTVTLLGNDDVIEDGDEVVLENPGRGALAILGLAHQIDFSNILPLYIVLLSLGPVLILLARLDGRLMLGASTAMYGIARLCSLNMPSWPDEGGWFFNPFAWQLLFSVGVFVGLQLRTRAPSVSPAPFNSAVFAACAAVLAISAVVVTDGFGLLPGLSGEAFAHLDADKRSLGLARLVHFLALAYVIYHSGLAERMRRTAVFAPLALIGRHSLPVFATGAFLCTVGLATIDDDWPGMPYTTMFLVAGLALHYVVAACLSRSRPLSAPAIPAAVQPATG